MKQSLDLIHLRSIVAVADCGGFGRAAAALHVSQSTTSQHIRSLERAIGRPVVQREGRTTRFTTAGEDLLTEARHILSVHDDALDRLTETADQAIVIGSTETAVDQVLPEILAALHNAYPSRRVQFSIDRSTQIALAVAKGEIDLAVGLGFPGDAGERIGSSELGWYGVVGGPVPQPGDEVRLIAYFEPCAMRQGAISALVESGYRVNVVAESTSLEGVIAATRAGLGISVLPYDFTSGTVHYSWRARAGLGISVLPYDHRTPHGLTRLTGLPTLGEIGVNLQFRRGLDPSLAHVARGALEELFDRKRPGASVAGADADIDRELSDHPSHSPIGIDRKSSGIPRGNKSISLVGL